MSTEDLRIVDMSPEIAYSISQWRYDGIYSFYDHNGQNPDSFMDGTHYACIDAHQTLIGYFCFGADARIPTSEENVYEDGFLDIGLGLRPDLCGDGFGITFINHGLDYARKYLGYDKFRLSVAAFNDRAIKVYLKAGFCKKCDVTNSYFKNKFYIMTLSQ